MIRLTVITNADEVIELPISAEGLVRYPINPTATISLHARVTNRVWNLGLAVAAIGLGLDLKQAIVERGQIRIEGPQGTRRIIPIDAAGYAPIPWVASVTDTNLIHGQKLEHLLSRDIRRETGETNLMGSTVWKGRLGILGSLADSGNNMSDKGATPLAPLDYLVSTHLNVANSLLTGRFVSEIGLATRLFVVLVLAILTAWMTIRFTVV